MRADLLVVQGENQLPGRGIHFAAVSSRAEDLAGGVREQLDSSGAGIRQDAARTLLKNQQVVGEQSVAALEKAGGERRFSECRRSQKRDCAVVDHDPTVACSGSNRCWTSANDSACPSR